MKFNPVSILGFFLLLLALLGSWLARRDLARGETRWLVWARMVAPIARHDKPARYWGAMALNILLVFLAMLVGVFALRAGFFRRF
jgi:hypothetical protein